MTSDPREHVSTSYLNKLTGGIISDAVEKTKSMLVLIDQRNHNDLLANVSLLHVMYKCIINITFPTEVAGRARRLTAVLFSTHFPFLSAGLVTYRCL